jgi:hypothetical protein
VSINFGTATPSDYKLGSAAVSAIYLGSSKVWPVGGSSALLTMTRSNNGGVITGWDGVGTTGQPFFFGAPANSLGEGQFIDAANGLSRYSWTATANCTVAIGFYYNDDDDNAYRAKILLNGTSQDIGPGASPTPTRRPPPEEQFTYRSGTTTGTLTMTAGQVLTFAATGPAGTQYFDNVSISAA